jgi:hypothetical protein
VLGIYPAKIVPYSENQSRVDYGDKLSVNTDEWATFGIVAQGHELAIKSFEVIIHKYERAQIGLMNNALLTSDFEGTMGVGEVQGTVALDCCRSVMLVNGALVPLDGTCKDGSTIRCEELGKRWYIDGRLVASADQSDNVTFIEANFTSCNALPGISTKGSFTVSDVEYYLH